MIGPVTKSKRQYVICIDWVFFPVHREVSSQGRSYPAKLKAPKDIALDIRYMVYLHVHVFYSSIN